MSVAAHPIMRDARGRVIVPPRTPGMRRRALRGPYLAMIRDLSRKYGMAFPTEEGKRRELYRRNGIRCGKRSIGRLEKELKARGEIGKERVAPYARRVDGETHHPGTTHTWIITHREQRQARRRAREKERQAKDKAARLERERLELEQQAREDEARELAARYEQRHPTATVLGEIVNVPKLASLLESPNPVAAPPAASAVDQERQRRERIAEQLEALARAGFELPKKPPDD